MISYLKQPTLAVLKGGPQMNQKYHILHKSRKKSTKFVWIIKVLEKAKNAVGRWKT